MTASLPVPGRWSTLRRVVAITPAGSHVLDCGHVRGAPSPEDGYGYGRSPMLRCDPCRKNTDDVLEQHRVRRGQGLASR